MRILISNDDGVHAPGIKILAEELRSIADVWVVAPLEERSTTGHTLTLDHPIRLVELEKQVYGCSGYPADCALMGMAEVMRDKKPDLVIGGINRGANLGQDVFYSGTVAVAREASFRNIPSIAVSTVLDFQNFDAGDSHYITAAKFIKKIVIRGVHTHLPSLHLLNINVPNLSEEDIEGHALTTLGFQKYSEDIQKRQDFRGRDYFWIGGIYKGHSPWASSDGEAISAKRISITPINLLNLTPDKEVDWHRVLEEI
jgi:5'-nucleotidase